MKEKENTGK